MAKPAPTECTTELTPKTPQRGEQLSETTSELHSIKRCVWENWEIGKTEFFTAHSFYPEGSPEDGVESVQSN